MIRVKEHALCSVCTVGVLEFYVPPFSNGMMKEYCPVCDGKQIIRRPSPSAEPMDLRPSLAEVLVQRGAARCMDCGKDLPVRRVGRKRERCVLHAQLWKRNNQAMQRKALRERRRPIAEKSQEVAA